MNLVAGSTTGDGVRSGPKASGQAREDPMPRHASQGATAVVVAGDMYIIHTHGTAADPDVP
ncbi:hypothetical protein GCM10015536_41350 [Streptomyces griseomycini]|nr:hypothetical protein GCM10015536_41350 [Streptomyces griseomycini]